MPVESGMVGIAFGLFSVAAAIFAGAWRLSGRLSRIESGLDSFGLSHTAFRNENHEDHKDIADKLEIHSTRINEHGERISVLEEVVK